MTPLPGRELELIGQGFAAGAAGYWWVRYRHRRTGREAHVEGDLLRGVRIAAPALTVHLPPEAAGQLVRVVCTCLAGELPQRDPVAAARALLPGCHVLACGPGEATFARRRRGEAPWRLELRAGP